MGRWEEWRKARPLPLPFGNLSIECRRYRALSDTQFCVLLLCCSDGLADEWPSKTSRSCGIKWTEQDSLGRFRLFRLHKWVGDKDSRVLWSRRFRLIFIRSSLQYDFWQVDPKSSANPKVVVDSKEILEDINISFDNGSPNTSLQSFQSQHHRAPNWRRNWSSLWNLPLLSNSTQDRIFVQQPNLSNALYVDEEANILSKETRNGTAVCRINILATKAMSEDDGWLVGQTSIPGRYVQHQLMNISWSLLSWRNKVSLVGWSMGEELLWLCYIVSCWHLAEFFKDNSASKRKVRLKYLQSIKGENELLSQSRELTSTRSMNVNSLFFFLFLFGLLQFLSIPNLQSNLFFFIFFNHRDFNRSFTCRGWGLSIWIRVQQRRSTNRRSDLILAITNRTLQTLRLGFFRREDFLRRRDKTTGPVVEVGSSEVWEAEVKESFLRRIGEEFENWRFGSVSRSNTGSQGSGRIPLGRGMRLKGFSTFLHLDLHLDLFISLT